MRESAFYVCENKDPGQLSGSRTSDQRLSFRYVANTNIRNFKPQAIFYVCTALSVSVLVGNLEYKFSRDAAQNMFALILWLMSVSPNRSCWGLTSSLIIQRKMLFSYLSNENSLFNCVASHQSGRFDLTL